MQSFFVSLGSCVYIYITTQSTSHNIGNIFIKQHNGRVLFVQHIPYPYLVLLRFEALLPNQKTTIPKPPTKSTFLPRYRPPTFPKAPNPPNLTESLHKIRTCFLTLVWLPPWGWDLILLGRRGMLHQKRHLFGQPAPFPHGEASWLAITTPT